MEISAKFGVQNTLKSILSNIPERSQDVIVSRFGIGRDDYETLEAIGERYGITRERVRQIEADALKQIKADKGSIAPLLSSLEGFIRAKGGVTEERNLTREFAKENFTGVEKPERYQGLVGLLLSVGDQFKKSPADDAHANRWYVDESALREQERLAVSLAGELKKKGEVADEKTVVALAQKSHSNLNRSVILNYLACSRNIKQNVFDQWGLSHWGEIRPRGVRDKAYLVLKQEGKPLHFRKTAELINQHGFSSREALAQTVHNEVIKDARFVLVGRGLYALKEWGYKEGTVKDVIKRNLKNKGPMGKDDLVKAVLAERFVKPSTVVLNLNSFKKNEEGKYTLA